VRAVAVALLLTCIVGADGATGRSEVGGAFRSAGLVPPANAFAEAAPGRLSPGGLQRKMAAELQHLEEVEAATAELDTLESNRVLAAAQREMVGLAQALEAQSGAAERSRTLEEMQARRAPWERSICFTLTYLPTILARLPRNVPNAPRKRL